MKIEYAKIKDATELAEVDKIGDNELNGWLPNKKQDFARIIKKSKNSIILAKNKNKIVGYLSSRPDKESKWLWVEDIYILKNWRKKGLAKLLIKKLVKYKNKKFKKRKIVLLTGNKNSKVFGRIGFKKTMNFMEYVK